MKPLLFLKSPWQPSRNQGLTAGGHDERTENVMPLETQDHSLCDRGNEKALELRWEK
jgi:hypothetical protein